MSTIYRYILILCIIMQASCRSNAKELVLPTIPPTLTLPHERAAYLLVHYWDNLDFSDSGTISDSPFMAQSFSDFTSVFPIAGHEAIKAGIDTMLSKASVNPEAVKTLLRIADDYLYEPESPVYNEEHYIIFLNCILDGNYLDESAKMRPRYQLAEALKNRVGYHAADFGFTDRKGNNRNLKDIQSKDEILLIFFNPDCDHCQQVLHELQMDETRKAEIDSGWLTVVAIYSGDEQATWQAYADTLPENWIVGIEPMKIYDEELYVLREFPTVYILDKEHRVKAKNVRIGN